MFGNPETTTGGNALKFYSSVRLDIRRDRRHQGRRPERGQPHPGEGGEEQDGAAVPQGGVRHHLRRGHQPGRGPARPRRGPRGWWRSGAPGIVYGETRIGQGRENASAFLKENPDLLAEIEGRSAAACGLGRSPGTRGVAATEGVRRPQGSEWNSTRSCRSPPTTGVRHPPQGGAAADLPAGQPAVPLQGGWAPHRRDDHQDGPGHHDPSPAGRVRGRPGDRHGLRGARARALPASTCSSSAAPWAWCSG